MQGGWFPAATRILRADNGSDTTLGELVRHGEEPLVWSLDECQRMVAQRMDAVLLCGRKEAFSLRMASGRVLVSTDRTMFLTVEGWKSLGALAVDDRLAIPRWTPEPTRAREVPDAEVILLAHMIGDGSCVKRQPIRYASIDEENLAAVAAAATHFGVTAVRDDYPAARVVTLRLRAPFRLTHGKRNPIAAWLDDLGLFGLRSHEKFVPEHVFALSTDQVALFLRHLWATDGSVRWDKRARQARIYYASTSLRLIHDVAQLLLRLEVHGRIKRITKPGYRDCWHLSVDGMINQRSFLEDIGAHGARGVAAEDALVELAELIPNTNVDTIPKEIWDRVRNLLEVKEIRHRDFQAAMGTKYCGSTMWKCGPSRSRLARVAEILDDSVLSTLARSDIFWDRIAEIASLGAQDVFEVTVPGTHNFVAGGITVHDSSGPAASPGGKSIAAVAV